MTTYPKIVDLAVLPWRRCWISVVTRATVLLLTLGLGANAWSARQNIVLFVADDLGRDLGCYGNPVIRTPHLDRLAQTSTRYTHCFATTASCSASRSVILSGLHNHTNGQYGLTHNYHHFQTHNWVQSLPSLLRSLGYRTARAGKYHVAPEKVYEFGAVIDGPERDPEALVENCRPFLEYDADQPFFLYIATHDPHRSGEVADDLPGNPNRFGNPAQETEGEITYSPEEVRPPPFLPDTPECRAELAQYYQSVSRVDRGVGRLRALLEDCGRWENTLVIVTSDHGVPFPGAKTTVWDPGLRIPLIVRHPDKPDAVTCDAMVSLLDLTPTLVDFAGGLDPTTGRVAGLTQQKWEWHTYTESDAEFGDGVEVGEMRWKPYTFHGRSLLPTLGTENSPGWDAVTASHTFHEVQMCFPMRVYRDRKYKLIWNPAYRSPFPFASDLRKSPTWQAQFRQGPDASYGMRTVAQVMQRPQLELYDIEQDPDETRNLSEDPSHAHVLADYIDKIKRFQQQTGDPWMTKWFYD